MLVNRFFLKLIPCFLLAFISDNVFAQNMSKQHEQLLQPHVISEFNFDFESSVKDNLSVFPNQQNVSGQKSTYSVAFNFYESSLLISSILPLEIMEASSYPQILQKVISIDYLGEEKVQVRYHNNPYQVYYFSLYELEIAMLETFKTAYNDELTNQAIIYINWDSFNSPYLKKQVFERTINSYTNFMELVSKSIFNKCIRNLDAKHISLLKSNFELVFLLDEWKFKNNKKIEALSASENDFIDHSEELYEFDELTNKSKY